MSKIDEVFQIFEDGRDHGVNEIAKAVSLPRYKVRKVLDFLARFGFIEYGGGKARVSIMGAGILTREKSSKFPVFL